MKKSNSVFDDFEIRFFTVIGFILFFLIGLFIGSCSVQYENIIADLNDLECSRIEKEYESLKKTIEIYRIEENQ